MRTTCILRVFFFFFLLICFVCLAVRTREWIATIIMLNLISINRCLSQMIFCTDVEKETLSGYYLFSPSCDILIFKKTFYFFLYVVCIWVYVLQGIEPMALCILIKYNTSKLCLPLLIYLKINIILAFSIHLVAYFVKIILI